MATYSVIAGLVRGSPREHSQTKHLPDQVWRQYEKPGGSISGPNFRTQTAEEIRISVAAEFAKNVLSNPVDRDRYQDKSEKEQAQKKR